MSDAARYGLSIALFLLASGSGVALSRGGRPLGIVLSAVHKIASLGFFAVIIFLFFNLMHFGILPPLIKALGVVTFVLSAALLATGAVLSGNPKGEVLRKAHMALMVLAALCLAVAILVS